MAATLILINDILPQAFTNRIIEINDEITMIRSNLNTMDDINKWVKDFGILTYTKWNSRKSNPNGERFICWKKFVCHHSSFMKVSTITRRSKCCNCEASIFVKIKKNHYRIKNYDQYVKMGLRAIITIKNQHSHPLMTKEVLQFLPPGEDLKTKFFKYFDYGMTISESRKFHESIIIAQDPYPEIQLINGRINPKEKIVRHWYDQWRESNLKEGTGVGLIEDVSTTEAASIESTSGENDLALVQAALEESYIKVELEERNIEPESAFESKVVIPKAKKTARKSQSLGTNLSQPLRFKKVVNRVSIWERWKNATS